MNYPEWLIRLVAVFILLQGSLPVAFATYAVEQLAPGLYVHEGGHWQLNSKHAADISNSGFIVGKTAVAVIDPGGSLKTGQQLRQYIESVTELPVEYLILTHFHPDHVFGAAAFSDVPNIIAHRNYPRAVTQRFGFYAERFENLLHGITELPAPEILVDVDQVLAINLGERELLLRAHPVAHTDNDLTIADASTNTLWASDLVFAERTPSLDGSLKGWLAVMNELNESQFALVVPGHGKPGLWGDVVEAQRTYLSGLRMRIKADIDQGLSLTEVVDKETGSTDKHWKLYKDQHPANVTKAYTELEWD